MTADPNTSPEPDDRPAEEPAEAPEREDKAWPPPGIETK